MQRAVCTQCILRGLWTSGREWRFSTFFDLLNVGWIKKIFSFSLYPPLLSLCKLKMPKTFKRVHTFSSKYGIRCKLVNSRFIFTVLAFKFISICFPNIDFDRPSVCHPQVLWLRLVVLILKQNSLVLVDVIDRSKSLVNFKFEKKFITVHTRNHLNFFLVMLWYQLFALVLLKHAYLLPIIQILQRNVQCMVERKCFLQITVVCNPICTQQLSTTLRVIVS